MTLVLASTSPYRAAILRDAGVAFDAQAASVDERAVEAPFLEAGLDPAGLAQLLAEAKATDVSARRRGALVLGADQTMALDGALLHKPADMREARSRLLDMSGRVHTLNSALAIVRDGETVWRHLSVAQMHVRTLSPSVVDRALTSVGAYQVEGEGIQLFDRIDGDHFTVIGLPLLPLLAELRDLGALDG